MPPKATPRMGVPKLKARWQVGQVQSGMSQLTVAKDMQLPLSVTATERVSGPRGGGGSSSRSIGALPTRVRAEAGVSPRGHESAAAVFAHVAPLVPLGGPALAARSTVRLQDGQVHMATEDTVGAGTAPRLSVTDAGVSHGLRSPKCPF